MAPFILSKGKDGRDLLDDAQRTEETWDDLTEKLKQVWRKPKDNVWVQRLSQPGYSLPVIAGLLESECDEADAGELLHELTNAGYALPRTRDGKQQLCPLGRNDLFRELVRVSLYSTFPFFFARDKKYSGTQFVQWIQRHNSTLSAVAALCVKVQGTKTGMKAFHPNPKIHAIVNFNLDALLQSYVRRCYPRGSEKAGLEEDHILRTIEAPSASSHFGRTNVYHMHGHLRFDRKAGDPEKEALDVRVLTEQEFFDFFNQPNSLFNYTFLHLLREYPCLFIGLSLRDDNLRRLLYYSRKERQESYIREGKLSKARRKSIRHYAIMPSPSLAGCPLTGPEAEVRKRFEEVSLSRLGVTALWVDPQFKELPECLGKVYQARSKLSTEEPLVWSDVYARPGTETR
jgi:hypothetical protein